VHLQEEQEQLAEVQMLQICTCERNYTTNCRFYVHTLQEEQEQLAEVEAEARGELRAAQEALREAQEAVAISADKVAQLSDALKEAKVRLVAVLV
jgi:hypothetical protein